MWGNPASSEGETTPLPSGTSCDKYHFRFCESTFAGEMETTIGVDFYLSEIDVNGKKIKVCVWCLCVCVMCVRVWEVCRQAVVGHGKPCLSLFMKKFSLNLGFNELSCNI